MKKLLRSLLSANSIKELMDYQPQVSIMYEMLLTKTLKVRYHSSDYKSLVDLMDINDFISVHYDFPDFFHICMSFLNDSNRHVLRVVKLTVLYYILEMYELLSSEFWSRRIPEFDASDCPFLAVWTAFCSLFDATDDLGCALTADEYDCLLDVRFVTYQNSKYSKIMTQIIGYPRLHFMRMSYVLSYEPFFVEIAYRYVMDMKS